MILNREVFPTGTRMKNKVSKSDELQKYREMEKKMVVVPVDQIARYRKKSLKVKWFESRGVLLLSAESSKLPVEKCLRYPKIQKPYRLPCKCKKL
ncbi:DDE_Tnp_1_7 domain-containing protein [Nephila pilipes]|uniref:DDE_Tnp_1_7 domain-containing protein n=1 Tax=Nephila pilipes TaxID=299642 RepID=A0A8X6IVC7_NEPPI|nr:DDE_Tnp_1_7 domain-containing protein [Nephila pilipes]